MKAVLRLALLVWAALGGAAHAQSSCKDLGPAKGFNVFLAGDFSATSCDVEGSLAAGGNVNVTYYSVGALLTSPATAVIAGQDFVLNSSWILGDIWYGRNASYPYYPTSGSVHQGHPIEFAQAFATLKSTSSTLARLTANGVTTAQWGGLYLSGSDPVLNAFQVQASDIANSWGIVVRVPSTSLAVVNVSGASGQFVNMGFDLGGLPREQVLYNFPDATSLTLYGVGIEGSILAPQAAVQFDNGVLQGALVADRFNGTGQVNDHPFLACIPVPSQGTPALSLSLHAPTSSSPGSSIDYVVSALNTGTAPATGASAVLTLPGGSTATIALGAIAAGASASGSASFQVPPVADRGANEGVSDYLSRLRAIDGSTLDASASVTWRDSLGASHGPASAAAGTVVRLPIIAFTASAAPSSLPGQPVSFSVTAQNTGSGDATQVTSGSQQFPLAAGASNAVQLSQTAPALAAKGAGESDAAYAARVAAMDGSAATYAYSATWQGTAQSYGATGGSTTGAVVAPLVLISLTATPAAYPGDTIQYAATLANSGHATAGTLQLVATLPDGTQRALTSPATLAAGATATVSFGFVIPPSQAVSKVSAALAATWADGAQSGYGPLSATASTAVLGRPALTIQLAGPASALPGGALAYSLTATNSGNAPATAATALVTLPDGSAVTASFGAIAQGSSAGSTASYQVPVVTSRAADESSNGYVARLQMLDGKALSASAALTWTDAAGAAYGPASASATTTERLPIVAVSASQPVPSSPGQMLTETFTFTNIGSADSAAVTAHLTAPTGATTDAAPLALASGASFALQSSGQAATLPTPNSGSTASYLASLTAIDLGGTAFAASADWTDAAANTYGRTGASAQVIEPLPILPLALAQPATVLPNGTLHGIKTVSGTAAVTNTGHASAATIFLHATLADGTTPTLALPASLGPGATASASYGWQLPFFQTWSQLGDFSSEQWARYIARLQAANGALKTSTFALGWSDPSGGQYGLSQQITSTVQMPIVIPAAFVNPVASTLPNQGGSYSFVLTNVGSSDATAVTASETSRTSPPRLNLSYGTLSPGQSSGVPLSFAVNGPTAPQTNETNPAYLARLRLMHGTRTWQYNLAWNDAANNSYGPPCCGSLSGNPPALNWLLLAPDVESSFAVPASVVPGQLLQIPVTVKNLGNATAMAPQGMIVMPDGSATPFAGSALAPAATLTMTANGVVPPLPTKGTNESDAAYRARLLAADKANVVTTGTVSSWTDGINNVYGPLSTAGTSVQRVPVLSLSSGANPQGAPGQGVTFTVTISNLGSGTSPAGALRVVQPDGVVVTTPVPSIAGNGSATLSASVRMPAFAPRGVAESEQDYRNRLVAGAGAPIAFNYLLDWTDSVGGAYGSTTGTLNATQLLPLLVATIPTRVTGEPGQQVTASVVVTNQLNGSASSGAMRLQLYDGSTVVVAMPAIAAHGAATLTASMTLPALAARGASEAEEIYRARLVARDGAPLVNTVLLDWTDAQANHYGTTSASFDALQVVPVLSLGLNGPAEVRAGDQIAYAASLHDSGSVTATGIALTVTMPDGTVQTPSLPALLEPRATTTAVVQSTSPAHPTSRMSASARVTWHGPSGASYGPLTASMHTIYRNSAPVVTAGAARIVSLPTQTISLAGAVSDDGLPLGSTLTTRWTQVSGPAPAAFGDATLPTSAVTLPGTGTYVLRLTASDGELTSAASVSVTLAQSNQPPRVTVNADFSVSTFGMTPFTLSRWANVNKPLGLAWSAAAGEVIATVNYGGSVVDKNFATIALDGTATFLGSIASLGDEPYLDVSAGLGGFQRGEIFANASGQIVRVAADGTMLSPNWGQVNGARDGMKFDQTGEFGGDLFMAAGDGAVRRFHADGTSTLLATLPAAFEIAVPALVPNDPSFGPVAGHLLVAQFYFPTLYSVGMDGSVTSIPLPPNLGEIESVVAVSPGQTFLIADVATNAVWAAPTRALEAMTGSILISYESGDIFRLRWLNGVPAISQLLVGPGGSWEGSLLAPVPIAAPPPLVAQLNGVVTDDGLPGGQLTSSWTQVSGPGTAAFENPSAPVTRASFTLPGLYVLRLTASDGVLSGSADIRVEVDQANQPPMVDAGGDVHTLFPLPVALQGTARDPDSQPGPLTVSWSLVAGPGSASFTAADQLSTGVSFSAPGTYRLRLTASDGALTAFGELTVTQSTQAALAVTPAQATTLVGDALQLVATVTDPASGAPLSGVPVHFSFTGANPDSADAVTDNLGTARVSHSGATPGNDALQASASVSGATIALGTAAIHWFRPLRSLTSSLANGSFWPLTAAQVASNPFDPPPVGAPGLKTALPTLNASGSPFSDALIDAAGMPSGTVSLTLPACYQGAFSGLLLVASAGDVPLLVTANAYRLGIGHGATRVSGPLESSPAGGVGAQLLPLLASSAAGSQTTATIHFPSAGSYPYELDVRSCGSSAVALGAQGTGPSIPPASSLQIIPSQSLSLPPGSTQQLTIKALALDGSAQGGVTVTLAVTGANAQNLTALTDTTGTAVISYQGAAAGTDSLQAKASLPGTLAVSNQLAQTWVCCALPFVNAPATVALTMPQQDITLTGTASGYLLPGQQLTYRWRQLGGAAAIAGLPAPSKAVAIHAPLVGGYSLEFGASVDGINYATAPVALTLQGAQPGLFVDAGAASTIQLPVRRALLPGVATLGGIADPSVSASWSVISGPAAVLFDDSTSPTTNATFVAAGVYQLRLTASANGLTASADTSVTVNPEPTNGGGGGAAQPPIVSAGGDRTIALPNATLLLSGTALGTPPQGATLALRWRQIAGPAAIAALNPPASSREVQAVFTAAGSYVVEFGAAVSGLTGWSTDTATITVLAVPTGLTVNAGGQQQIVLPANAATLQGLVAPSNAAVLWSQVSGPSTASFDNATSASTRVVFPATPGVYVLQLSASSGGQAQSAITAVVVEPAEQGNQPPIVSIVGNQFVLLPATATLSGRVADDGLPAGSLLTSTWSTVSGPGTVTFADPFAQATTASFSMPGVYLLQLAGCDSQYTTTSTITITVRGQTAPTVSAGGTINVAWGQAASLDAFVQPTTEVFVLAWSQVQGAGATTFTNAAAVPTTATFSYPGSYLLRLSATTTDHQTATGDTVVNVSAPAGNLPVVSLDSPSDAGRVTQRTAVVANVSEGAWKLEAALDGDDTSTQTFTLLSSGVGAVSHQSIATFDPTLMVNGTWTLRLTAATSAGEISTEVGVAVDGNLKLGPLAFATTDMIIPAPGLPLSLVRSYDTKDLSPGDFGAGWRLTLANVRIEKNTPIGRGWYEDKQGSFAFPSYCLNATRTHLVTVTFPSGKVYRFQANTAQQCQALSPYGTADIIFAPLDGTTGTLEILDGGNTGNIALVDNQLPGPFTLTTETGALYNPRRFRLTLHDGTQYVIRQQGGVESITDRNGNTLRFSLSGIASSNGRNLSFTRDSSNRITQIADPAGAIFAYAYSPQGDLVTTTDRDGRETTYGYDGSHHLVKITDARGIDVLGVGYDADGRMTSATDASGRSSSIDRNLDARIETLLDKLGNQTEAQYDERGNPIKATDALGNVTQATFDGHDNKLSETDPLNHTTSWTYDFQDNQTSTTDPLQHATGMTYNTRGQVVTATDANNHTTTNEYDEQIHALQFPTGRLLSTTDALNQKTTYTYDDQGQVTSVTDALGATSFSEYDGYGRLSKQTDALGNATVFTYDANGNQLTETRTRTVGGLKQSLVTSYTYDNSNHRLTTTMPDGSSTETKYRPTGKAASTTDALGRTTRYGYDDQDRLERTDYPDGTSTSQTYDAQGRRATSTDKGGRITSYAYDAVGRLTTTTFADGTTRVTAYDAAGRAHVTTDELSQATTMEYDEAVRRRSVTDALGNVTSFAYDNAGNQTGVTDALLHTTSFAFDELNRQKTTTYADGSSESTEYDPQGNRHARVDQAGLRTEYGYDLLGRLTFVKDALGQFTRYGYDELGNRTSQTDANGHATSFAYDQLGRRLSRTLPLGQVETFTYHADGQLKTRTDFNGRTTSYAYDAASRLTSRTPDAFFTGEPAVGWTYYPTGRRKTMSDATGLTSYSYDARDRLMQRATPQGTLTYTYDLAGNRGTVRSDSGAYAVDYGYDALNRLQTVTDRNAGGGTTTYHFDAAGRPSFYAYPNGITSTNGFDSANHLTSVALTKGPSTVASYTYTLGPTGNRQGVTEASGRCVAWHYDSLYRLDTETITGTAVAGAIGYTYDAVGNRKTRSSSVAGIALQASSYDDNDRLLLVDGWDADGNTLASGGNRYGYDSENRLLSLNASQATYSYDGDGQLVGKTLGGVTTAYLVDGENPTGYTQIVEERVGGAVSKSYVYGPQRISMRDAGGLHYYGYDAHSGVRVLLDASGAVTDTYEFDAFGNLLARTGTTANDFTYQGELFDRVLGQQWLRMPRWLNPASGRFSSRDSWEGDEEVPDSLHAYAYVNNRPLDLVDPSGHVGEEIGAIGDIGSALGTAASATVSGRIAQKVAYGTTLALLAGGAMAGLQAAQTDDPGARAALAEYAQTYLVQAYFIFKFARGAQIAANKVAGDKFRDNVAQWFKDGGFQVEKEVPYTIQGLGKRVVDIEVRDPAGTLLWRIETKTGGSRYSLLQRLKDAWLQKKDGVGTTVLRNVIQ